MKEASSADKGVVIDLKNLNGVELNDDKSIVRLGAGNRWERVFEELAKDGLAVAGGRAGDVGVGGYSLGGEPASKPKVSFSVLTVYQAVSPSLPPLEDGPATTFATSSSLPQMGTFST